MHTYDDEYIYISFVRVPGEAPRATGVASRMKIEYLLLAVACFLMATGCNPSGTCESVHDEATGQMSCADVNERACVPEMGTFSAGKTCEELGYTCDENGNGCLR